MNGLFERMQEVIASLSLVRKMTMLIVLALSVGVIGYMVHVARQSTLEPLFTNLNSEDMGEIVTRLDKQGIHYELERDKRSVMVPSTDVLNIRLKLAEEGLPRFGGVGFELFDRAGFGMSEFEQRVNYQRAMEGELTRTIGNIREVESARVHLVLPEKSLFADAQQEASAAVVLKLGNVGRLSESTVKAIQHLVGSAVEGLDPAKVTIVDTAGHLLTAAPQVGGMASSGVLDQKIEIERNYERRIVELISPVVGLGKVIARVTASIDFTQTENTDEVIDPQKVAVVSESRSAAKRAESSGGSSGGAAGASANLPGGAGGSAGGGNGTSDESTEQITYAVSKSTQKKITPIGAVQKLSVAVLVDGLYEEKDGKPVYQARDTKQIGQLEELVKRAVGFDTARGDQLKVENLEFKGPELENTKAENPFAKRTTYGFMISIIGNVLVVLVLLLVVMFVIRPMMQSWKAARQNALAAGGDQMLLGGGDVGNIVRSDPSVAANAIRQWLQ